MTLIRRKPLDNNEAADLSHDSPQKNPAGPGPGAWEEALRESKSELERARQLLARLETITAFLEERIQSGIPWPGEE